MNEEQFIPLGPLLTQLGILLTISLMVERFLAAFNWIMDKFFIIKSCFKWEKIDLQKEKLEIEKRATEESRELANSKNNNDPREIEPFKKYAQPDSRFDFKKFGPPNEIKIIKEFWAQIFGTFVAIAGCYYMKFSLWPLVAQAQQFTTPINQPEAHIWEFIITGIIIGAGSKPIHFLMNFLINRRIYITRDEAKTEAAKPFPKPTPVLKEKTEAAVQISKPVDIPTISDYVGFQYDGGYRPDRLENTHFFAKKPDLIVYHHTAMHSDSPFEEVVKEFERKGWLTGYHCVVLKDGTIHVLCRWDRFGNHVRGYNTHSLGVALHGNFEPNPAVPFANVDGRLGILYPTEEQIKAAARVVALWSQMYDIKLDFDEKIVPHNKLAPKACPGSNFPHKVFHNHIKEYVRGWKKDDKFEDALKDFKKLPMVMYGRTS